MIRFIMMLKANPDKAAAMVVRLKTLKSDRRVKIRETYIVFGKYDAAMLFDCSDSAQATEFALRVSSQAHCTTETFMATPVGDVKSDENTDKTGS